TSPRTSGTRLNLARRQFADSFLCNLSLESIKILCCARRVQAFFYRPLAAQFACLLPVFPGCHALCYGYGIGSNRDKRLIRNGHCMLEHARPTAAPHTRGPFRMREAGCFCRFGQNIDYAPVVKLVPIDKPGWWHLLSHPYVSACSFLTIEPAYPMQNDVTHTGAGQLVRPRVLRILLAILFYLLAELHQLVYH